LCLIFAIPARETVLSAVTTTRSDALSTYQAMPSTPDCCTALFTAESWPALYSGAATAAVVGRANAPAATTPTVAATSRGARPGERVRLILTISSSGVGPDGWVRELSPEVTSSSFDVSSDKLV